MQNEFEKQVQQKMEELNFVPSEPVWEKIEEQIRKKKDRRKAFLWLPFLLLLLAGGSWWLSSTNETSIATGGMALAKKQKTRIENTAASLPNTNKTTAVNTNAAEQRSLDAGAPGTQSVSAGIASIQEQNTTAHQSKSIAKNAGGSVKISGGTSKENNPVARNSKSTRKENAAAPLFPLNVQETERPTALPIELLRPRIQIKKPAHLPLPSLATRQPEMIVLKTNKKKWVIGAEAMAGISGASTGVDVFSDEKKIATTGTTRSVNPPLLSYDYASSVKNSLSYAIGFFAKKPLGRRMKLATGLSYHLYSTRMKVGQKLNYPAGLFANTSVPVYVNFGSTLKDFYNKYHFITVPLALEYQVLKNTPFYVRGGISVQQMVASDALQFDGKTQVYYHDEQSLMKTEVFANLGFDYAFLPSKKLSAGPELTYGISRFEPASSPHHLFSLGLKARYILR